MRYIVCVVILAIVHVPSAGICSWDGDPEVNLPVCESSGNQSFLCLVSDGAFGFIAIWEDYRSGSDANLYAQRVNENGVPLWANNGIPVTRATGNQIAPVAVPDGLGGVIVYWVDYRNGNGDIFGQRLNSAGKSLWTTDGIAICDLAGNQGNPAAAFHGIGNTVVAWQDFRSDSFGDIYAQRIAIDGSELWSTGGIPVCTAVHDQWNPKVCWTATDSCFIGWEDFRNGLDTDIYAQRYNSSGTAIWTGNGVPVFKSTGHQANLVMVTDQAGGFIALCTDNRRDVEGDISGQRIDETGSKLWGFDSLWIDRSTGYQTELTAVPDDTGGVILAWIDGRDNVDGEIYAQRVTGSGTMLWGSSSLPVNTEEQVKKSPTLTLVSTGSVIIAWEKWINPFDIDLYAQKIKPAGGLEWDLKGIPVSTALEDQVLPLIISDSFGGGFCAWQHYTGDPAGDIFAQRIFFNGKQSNPSSITRVPAVNDYLVLAVFLVCTMVTWRSIISFTGRENLKS